MERFLAAAGDSRLRVGVVDVPGGHHTFDVADPGPESADAVRSALAQVSAALAG